MISVAFVAKECRGIGCFELSPASFVAQSLRNNFSRVAARVECGPARTLPQLGTRSRISLVDVAIATALK